MAERFAVLVEGIKDLQELQGLKKNVRLAAVQAINKTATSGRADLARNIRDQVNFPASYVSPSSKRLYVSKMATQSNLEAKITARTRATSLARFVTSSNQGTKGVVVEVHPGKARLMKRAFLIKLPAGTGDIDTKFNMGLAIRLKAGERLTNKRQARMMSKGLYLLYGPSVDQVFRAADGSGAAEDAVPKLEARLEREFFRLLDL